MWDQSLSLEPYKNVRIENNTMYSTKGDAVILKFSTNFTIIYFDALCNPSAIPMLEVVVC